MELLDRDDVLNDNFDLKVKQIIQGYQKHVYSDNVTFLDEDDVAANQK